MRKSIDNFIERQIIAEKKKKAEKKNTTDMFSRMRSLIGCKIKFMKDIRQLKSVDFYNKRIEIARRNVQAVKLLDLM